MIATQEVQLIGQRHQVALAAVQHVAIDLGQQVAELACPQGIARHQVAQRVQAVEEEVRVDLGLQGAQLGLRAQAFQALHPHQVGLALAYQEPVSYTHLDVYKRQSSASEGNSVGTLGESNRSAGTI